MKRNGFTLVEVIGVIVVLALIILTIVPNISDSLKNSRNKAYDTQLVEIKDAARSWSALNSSNLPTTSSDKKIITLLQLKLAGLISYDYTNAKTGKLFPDDMQIEIIKKGLTYEYNVLIDSGSSNTNINPLGPQIVLNGSSYLYLEVNSNSTIPNAIYKDINNNYVEVTDIKYQVYGEEEVTTTNIINMSELGKYNIIYTAKVNGIENSIKRYVEVRDTTAPIIEIAGYTNGQTIVNEMSDTFILPTATYTDNYTNSVSIRRETISNFSKVPGIKKVIYKATDTSNNTSEFILYVDMKDTIPPTITSISTQYNNSLNKNVVIVEATDIGVGLHNSAYSFDNGKTWQSDNYFVVTDTNRTNIVLIVRDKLGLQTEGIKLYEQKEYAYTGDVQEFTAPRDGYYKIELWGASGGDTSASVGGYGGYTSGVIELKKSERLSIYVGGQGVTSNATSSYTTGGYNGGGSANYSGGTGGGATDIRYLLNTLNNRIMVAAGGGGSGNLSEGEFGGNGGALYGEDGGDHNTSYPNGGGAGTPIVGGLINTNNVTGESNFFGTNGLFGIGGNGGYSNSYLNGSGAGAGGYYGGAGGSGRNGGGGGGSSFISGYAGVNAITSSTDRTHTNNTIHYSNKYFINGKMESGVNTGNGKAKITYIGEAKPERKNTKLNNVRYIKDCINGSNKDQLNHWVELQAIKNGVNLAKASNKKQVKEVSITNLITNGSFENGSTGWVLENAAITNEKKISGNSSLNLKANVSPSMSKQTLIIHTPKLNHKYYARLNFLSSSTFTTPDSRFEWYFSDDNGTLKFFQKDIPTNNWIILSSVSELSSASYLDETWYIRNFTVNATTDSFVDDLIIIDLTEAFGAGNEPSKEWCDLNISYFEGTKIINIYEYEKENSVINVSGNDMVSSDVNNMIDNIVDGDISNSGYGTTNGNTCITVDLESTYNLDEIAVWHYWADNRTYNDNITYVSSDNSNWTEVIHTTEIETSNGKRVSVYE